MPDLDKQARKEAKAKLKAEATDVVKKFLAMNGYRDLSKNLTLGQTTNLMIEFALEQMKKNNNET